MSAGIGCIAWHDLTVPNATQVRDFYSEVVGWRSSEQSMGDYSDYNMLLPENGDGGGECVAGICHARGENAGVPAQWLVYLRVADLTVSLAGCVRLGGEVLHGPRSLGNLNFAIIRDPAGAVCALFEDVPAVE